MDRSFWLGSYLGGSLIVFVPFVLLVSAFAWMTRRERLRLTPVDIVVGMSVGLAVSLVVLFVVNPQSSFGVAVGNSMTLVVAFSIILPSSYLRTKRWRRKDAEGRRAARAVIPSAARDYFASEDFQRELAGITEAHPPTPETASDVIAYWVFRALDSGEYVEWSRLIFYATAVKRWHVATPPLAGTVPWLVAPFQASGDTQWDPSVDRDFREYGGATLIARFGMPVPA